MKIGPHLLRTEVLGVCSLLQVTSTLVTLRLAFQSLGVVYGDLGTSPLYVFRNTFRDRDLSKQEDYAEDVLGALSLIFYSVALIPLIKYCFIVMRASDHGEGETTSKTCEQWSLRVHLHSSSFWMVDGPADGVCLLSRS